MSGQVDICIECKVVGVVHYHHIVPRSRGGTATVPLCEKCHGLVHSEHNPERFVNSSFLVREALKEARRNGVVLGRPFKTNKETNSEILNLHNRGLSQRQIVKIMNGTVSLSTICRIIKRYKTRL